MKGDDAHRSLRAFYEGTYYADASDRGGATRHLRRLAKRLIDRPGQRVLDVACGTGDWLSAAADRDAKVTGIDIAAKAVAVAQERIPGGIFVEGVAESLPFPDRVFDLVTCLGALEHFPDKAGALREMGRVLAGGGRVLILVPNAGFLTRRLGWFRGTEQVAVREDVLDLDAWRAQFEANGFQVERRWRDLHVLSLDWLLRRGWPHAGPRLLQAVLLSLWPLTWQYQVYHLLSRESEAQ